MVIICYAGQGPNNVYFNQQSSFRFPGTSYRVWAGKQFTKKVWTFTELSESLQSLNNYRISVCQPPCCKTFGIWPQRKTCPDSGKWIQTAGAYTVDFNASKLAFGSLSLQNRGGSYSDVEKNDAGEIDISWCCQVKPDSTHYQTWFKHPGNSIEFISSPVLRVFPAAILYYTAFLLH